MDEVGLMNETLVQMIWVRELAYYNGGNPNVVLEFILGLSLYWKRTWL